MNERIRELVKQSGGEFWQRIESDGVLNPEAYITFDPPESLEKFAELIVQECCQLIDDSTPVYSPENLQEDYCKGKLDGYHAALLEIREHFGVDR